MKIRGLVVLTAAAAALTCADDAAAACNTIPDAETVVMMGPNPTPEAQKVIGSVKKLTQTELASVESGRSYKGALGRVDEIYLVPALRSVLIEPDGVCVSSPEEPASPDAILDGEADLSGVVVGLLTVSRDRKQSTVELYGSAAVCEQYPAKKKFGTESHRITVHSCESEGLEKQPLTGSPSAIRVSLPQYDSSHPPPGIDGTTTIAALRSADQLVSQLSQIASRGCRAACDDLVGSGGLVCVDRIYSPRAGNSVVYDSDPIPCQVQRPTGIGMTNFKVQCQDGAGVSGLEKCDDNPTFMEVWEDDCGGVHFPFYWKFIRRDAAGSNIDREVAGYSAISREQPAQPPRVHLPGREFVGSTPYGPKTIPSGSTDWRFPNIEVDDSRSEETGLKGVVDKETSIVHIFPRMPVGVLCDTTGPDEACMEVVGRIQHKGIECACDQSPCTTCTTISPSKYFACVDPSTGPDSRDDMPCTRHEHCGPTGKCMGQPFCQDKKTVWLPGRPNTGSNKCWFDSDCTDPNQECGYRLFDLSSHVPAGTTGSRRFKRDATIVPGASRKQLGVCKDDRTKVCDNKASGPTSCANDPQNVKCRGFILEALGPAP